MKSKGRRITIHYSLPPGIAPIIPFSPAGAHEKKLKLDIAGRLLHELGEFWDKHDLTEFWNKTKKVKFEVVLEPEATYYPVEKELSDKIQSVARKHGVRSDALVNRWLGQKLKEVQKRKVGT